MFPVFLFNCIIYFILSTTIFSDFLLQFPVEADNDKIFGTKTIERAEKGISLKLSYFLFILFKGSLNSVIPLSLDSFNSYGEKTLENIWSFDEVISLEIILLTILLLLCQIPLILIVSLNNEKEISVLPEYWKALSFIVFIASGVLTPTIDGYTQLSFAFSALSLYLIIIIILTKRLDIKFSAFKSLSF